MLYWALGIKDLFKHGLGPEKANCRFACAGCVVFSHLCLSSLLTTSGVEIA
jgi:hypothetical protein